MANIIGYSSGYLKNTQANQIGVYQSGSTGALVPVYEPKLANPEKAGDAPIERITCTVPATRMDGTGLATGDQFYVAPCPVGARLYGLSLDVTAGATATTYTVSVGNATSATAYATSLDLKTAANTTVAQTVLDAAAAGASSSDALILTVITATAVTVGATVLVTMTYGVP